MAPSGVGAGTKLALGLIILLAAVVAVAPAAHAQSFSVATNKDVYNKGERVIVAGTLPDSDGSDVVVQIKKDDRQCALQVMKGGSESFVSRPLSIGNCGSGEYIVTVYHSGAAVQSKFIVASTDADAISDDFILRTMKNFILTAQEKATEKVKEVINSGGQLPQQAAEPYQAGIIETSLALQALERGDDAGAQGHQTAAFSHFRETIDALSAERASTASQAQPQQIVAAQAPDRLAVLQDLYGRLVDLARKNGVQDDFSGIADLLSQAKSMSDQGNADGAKGVLDTASKLLEQARVKLVQKSEVNHEQERLSASADKLEKKANQLLEKAGPNGDAAGKIKDALSLIADARSAIMQGNFDSAKDDLFAASRALDDAQKAPHKHD